MRGYFYNIANGGATTPPSARLDPIKYDPDFIGIPQFVCPEYYHVGPNTSSIFCSGAKPFSPGDSEYVLVYENDELEVYVHECPVINYVDYLRGYPNSNFRGYTTKAVKTSLGEQKRIQIDGPINVIGKRGEYSPHGYEMGVKVVYTRFKQAQQASESDTTDYEYHYAKALLLSYGYDQARTKTNVFGIPVFDGSIGTAPISSGAGTVFSTGKQNRHWAGFVSSGSGIDKDALVNGRYMQRPCIWEYYPTPYRSALVKYVSTGDVSAIPASSITNTYALADTEASGMQDDYNDCPGFVPFFIDNKASGMMSSFDRIGGTIIYDTRNFVGQIQDSYQSEQIVTLNDDIMVGGAQDNGYNALSINGYESITSRYNTLVPYINKPGVPAYYGDGKGLLDDSIVSVYSYKGHAMRKDESIRHMMLGDTIYNAVEGSYSEYGAYWVLPYLNNNLIAYRQVRSSENVLPNAMRGKIFLKGEFK